MRIKQNMPRWYRTIVKTAKSELTQTRCDFQTYKHLVCSSTGICRVGMLKSFLSKISRCFHGLGLSNSAARASSLRNNSWKGI